MRFIQHGPNVPDSLVQAHEDGKVVFFCGAGISYPAGLPGFKDLTTQIFEALGEDPTPVENLAIVQERFDGAIDLLERRVNNRLLVRKKLQTILTPNNLADPGSTATHQALLQLANSPNENVRIITTNFDRIFHHVNPSLRSYIAPLVPIPKKSRWNGVVYLHGLLPEGEDFNALHNLVLSSGDFGLAYLTERWASRFVSELLRNYIVCFVGYSLSDPVLRYMLDALAADRLRGEDSNQVFSFGSYEEGEKEKVQEEWEAKGVVPILYSSRERHSLLHKTLNEWAGIYRDGIMGKQAIIMREASLAPSPRREDGHVDRVLWALMDPTGQSAKTFAELDPAPPIAWLEIFMERRFSETDLEKLGVASSSTQTYQKPFSLLDRPTSQNQSNPVSLVTPLEGNLGFGHIDEMMSHLARWIIRHLEKPETLTWAIKSGCTLHPSFKDLVLRNLNDPNQTLAPALRAIWRFICSGLVTNNYHGSAMILNDWVDQLQQSDWSLALKREFYSLLQPKIQFRDFPLRARIRHGDSPIQQESEKEPQIKEFIDWDIVLPIGENPWEKLGEIKANRNWSRMAVECLPGFTSSLNRALDLMAELDGANEKCDLSYIHRPSIIDHHQNREFREWTCLISLCREAWLTVANQNNSLAKLEFERWKFIKYPLFKRLLFFATAETTLFEGKEALEVLLMEKGWWLWSPETQRESFQLLLRLSRDLNPQLKDRLFASIMAGPPREMYREDLEEGAWEDVRDRSILVRLKIVERDGGALTPEATTYLSELQTQYSEWQLQPEDRDHFPYWTETGSGGLIAQHVTLPTELNDLVAVLERRPIDKFFYEDDWRNICQSNPPLALKALKELAQENIWNIDVWRDALQVFAEGEPGLTPLEEIGPCLINAPNTIISELRHSLSWWIKPLAKTIPEPLNSLWFQLLDRILDNADTTVNLLQGDPVGRAINNPVGHVIEALLNRWYKTLPQAGMGIPDSIKIRLSRMLQPEPKGFVHGRVIMSAHLFSLYAVDPTWTSAKLLPLFNWETDEIEAQGVWEGYLWTPRISAELLASFKNFFLETANHYEQLGKHGEQYASLLVVAALEFGDQFSATELRTALNALPNKGLAEAAKSLARSLNAADDRRAEYWVHRVEPLIKEVWPKSAAKRSGHESKALMEICIYSDTHFAEACHLIKDMIVQTRHFYLPVKHLAETQLSNNHPQEALSLLNAIIDTTEQWPRGDLRVCLNQIISGDADLEATPEFRRLSEYLDQHNL